jgi:hypothetical protein
MPRTEQVAKAEKAVASKAAVKRNRFITLNGATKTVNRALEAKHGGNEVHPHNAQRVCSSRQKRMGGRGWICR